MAAYRNAILKMSARFEGLEFYHIARENNQAADVLARIGAKREAVPPNIFLERLFKPIARTQLHCPSPNILTQLGAPPTKQHRQPTQ